MKDPNMKEFYCTEYNYLSRYFVEDFTVGSIGFYSIQGDLTPLKVVKVVSKSTDPKEFEEIMAQEGTLDKIFKSDCVAEFITDNDDYFVWFQWLFEKDLVVKEYC